MEFQQPPAAPALDVTQPPPQLTVPSALATNVMHSQQMGNSAGPHFRNHHFHHGHFAGANKTGHSHFKPFNGGNFQRPFGMTQDDFDGKRLRKSVMRKTVDYNASIVKALETRLWQRDFRDRHALQPESIYVPELVTPSSYLDNPSNAVTTRFVKTATNKMRCPIFTLAWTPEGRRLVTGASSGEFTLWNGLTFNFETILQAHDVPVRTMVWSHNDSWMVTGDHSGYVKYWQSNMNNVKMFQAHKEAIRGISFSPTDSKFVSCSDDGTLRIWDFLRCQEERVLRGHGADVKCVHWHPQKGLIVSGSKDNQQPIKLWDPKSGSALATLHAHKSTVMDLKWNDNGNWLVTASRDHLLKLFDLRNLREEMQVFRGHKKEASSVAWHPVHEGLFCSGGSDGSILFWNVGTDKEIGGVETAHDSIVWTLAWHPLGHILCSGSNDHTIKFWTRNRPGDLMRDKYNLNTLPASLAALDDCEYDDAVIPGMGPEDKVEFTESLTADKGFIPGLDLDGSKAKVDTDKEKKVPYSKPIPRNFLTQWTGAQRRGDEMDMESTSSMQAPMPRDMKEPNSPTTSHQQTSEYTIEGMLASGVLTTMDPQTIVGILVHQRFIRVHPDSRLMMAVRQGQEYLNKYIDSGKLEELRDIVPLRETSRSLSPIFDTRENQSSPPSKKSRFEPRQHFPQVVTVREMLSLKKPFMPCLLNMKQTNMMDEHGTEEISNQMQKMLQQSPQQNQHNNRPSPWAMGVPGPQSTAGIPSLMAGVGGVVGGGMNNANVGMGGRNGPGNMNAFQGGPPPSPWANGPPNMGNFNRMGPGPGPGPGPNQNGFAGNFNGQPSFPNGNNDNFNNNNNNFSGPPQGNERGGMDDRDVFSNNGPPMKNNNNNNNNNNSNMRRNRGSRDNMRNNNNNNNNNNNSSSGNRNRGGRNNNRRY